MNKKRKTVRKIHDNSYWVEDEGFVDRERMEYLSKYINWSDVNYEDNSIERIKRKQVFQYYLQQELMKVKIEKMKAKGTWKPGMIITPENLLDTD